MAAVHPEQAPADSERESARGHRTPDAEAIAARSPTEPWGRTDSTSQCNDALWLVVFTVPAEDPESSTIQGSPLLCGDK